MCADSGQAVIMGAWKDIGRFKVPTLRGLAVRAPYLHDGSTASLMDAVTFIDARFSIGFIDSEQSDLVAFLNALCGLRSQRRRGRAGILNLAVRPSALRRAQRGLPRRLAPPDWNAPTYKGVGRRLAALRRVVLRLA
jgi:hypothetical protein